jgi:hypothetical protein
VTGSGTDIELGANQTRGDFAECGFDSFYSGEEQYTENPARASSAAGLVSGVDGPGTYSGFIESTDAAVSAFIFDLPTNGQPVLSIGLTGRGVITLESGCDAIFYPDGTLDLGSEWRAGHC